MIQRRLWRRSFQPTERSLSAHRMAFLLTVFSLSRTFSEKTDENVELEVISIRGIQESEKRMKIQSVLQKVLCIAACAAVSSVVAQTVEKPIPPIHTEGGQLAGKVLASGVKAWLGVPYAKPPVNDLRWQPPQPFSWKGVWNADRTMPECLQVQRSHDTNQYFGEEPASENCLYMNIWAPANATAGAKLPVIVYIYGGGFAIGSSGMPLYGGEHVAQQGAIFVNFNYRLGILGFMAHPELTKEQGGHSGDYAFLDQNAALKWVQNNIAKFGGDPSQVLLMGQSAGAGSVTQQVFSPLSKGLFRAAVMSSGCTWASDGPMQATTLAQGEELGLQIQKLLHAANLDEMRQVPSDRILALQGSATNHGVMSGPVIDGYFMPKTQLEILKAHEINDVPIIASSNGDEMDSAQYPLTTARTVAEYKDIAQKMYGGKADEFLALYPVSSDAGVSSRRSKHAGEAGVASHTRCPPLLPRCGSPRRDRQDHHHQGLAWHDMFAVIVAEDVSVVAGDAPRREVLQAREAERIKEIPPLSPGRVRVHPGGQDRAAHLPKPEDHRTGPLAVRGKAPRFA